MPLLDSSRKARGAFFTPPAIGKFIADWAVQSSGDAVLEPSCGDAAFLLPAADRLVSLGAVPEKLRLLLHGLDIHGPSVQQAEARLNAAGFEATLSQADFFDRAPAAIYDAVIGNPPYIRYQQFSGDARTKGLQAALAQGVRLNALASSWAAFTIHASQFLKPEGRLGLVLPAELLSVGYAGQVRRFLMNRFAKVRLIVFEQLLFPGVLEEVVLLLAEGRGISTSFELYQARDAEDLAVLSTSSSHDFVPTDEEKWTPALLAPSALHIYRQLTGGRSFTKLVEWGETYLGAVTGNNKFFTLSATDVARLGLRKDEVLRISAPGARHLRGLSFTTKAWEELANAGTRCFLFSPSVNPSPQALAYIHQGEKEGIHQAYKCSVRSPWWRVPLVAKPDLLFAYMNHERPRLIANEAEAFVLNSLYGVTLKREVRDIGKAILPLACLNTVTLLGSEVVGRSYGGGLLKHEPREADRLPVPTQEVLRTVQRELELIAPQLSVALRRGDLSKAVQLVDNVILERHLRLDADQIAQLRNAREAMFQRRLVRGRG